MFRLTGLALLSLALVGHGSTAGPVPCEVAVLPLVAGQDTKAEAAEPPKISGPDVVPAHKLVRLTVSGIPVGHFILWDVYPPDDIDAATQKLKSLYEFAAPPGTYKVRVRAFKADSETPLEAWRTVTVQGATPVPPGPGPTPPGPTPPTPPQPAPPIAGGGNRVLIVFESGDLPTYPSGQVAAMQGAELSDYLRAKTARDAENPQGAFRIWDKDVTTKTAWKDVLARPRASHPWVVISNGKTGFEGPLPKTGPEIMALLKKYFGE